MTVHPMSAAHDNLQQLQKKNLSGALLTLERELANPQELLAALAKLRT